MDFMEANMHAIKQCARDLSAGENIDEHWERILPEVLDFAGNEILLTLYRVYINELMKQNAALAAQTFPPRDIDNLNNAELWLHSYTREWWLKLSEDGEFQALVDEHRSVIYNTTDPVIWVKPSRIWLPHFDAIDKQIYLSLVERYKQAFFARRCWAELMRRAQDNEYIKHMFILLVDTTRLRQDWRQESNKANNWLCDKSRSIATDMGIDPNVGEDARQGWIEKLLRLPLHQRIQKAGATGKAIHDGVIDIQRKGGKYEHVSFDEDLTNPIPDESAEATNENLIANEYNQRLLECQSQIEAILSRGRPEQGKRRFKAMQLIAHTPHLTSSEIANQLRTSEPTMRASEPTICRDRQIIRQSKDRIKAILQS